MGLLTKSISIYSRDSMHYAILKKSLLVNLTHISNKVKRRHELWVDFNVCVIHNVVQRNTAYVPLNNVNILASEKRSKKLCHDLFLTATFFVRIFLMCIWISMLYTKKNPRICVETCCLSYHATLLLSYLINCVRYEFHKKLPMWIQ